MLKVKDLHAYYGSIEALRGIDLEVSDKSIVCLIGSNGAGKTTLFKIDLRYGAAHRTY